VNDDELSDEDDASDRWLPVSGPLSPARAAVVALALEQAGIEVAFLDAEPRTLPSPLVGGPLGGQQLAVREPRIEAAREIVARTHTAFRDEAFAPASLPKPDPVNAPAGRTPALVVEAEHEAEAAFEALRVRRYKQGLLVFVIGLVWTLAVLPSVREDALMAVIGAAILCAGLFRIYAALSLRRHEEEDGSEKE